MADSESQMPPPGGQPSPLIEGGLSAPAYELTASDTEVVEKILRQTYDFLQGKRFGGLPEHNVKIPEVIGRSDVCEPMSDVVIRIAQGLGVVASREVHQGHLFISFTPINQLPGEDDLVLCTTWGQFNQAAFEHNPSPFFGRRADMARLVGPRQYALSFSSESVRYRQVAHAPIIEDGQIMAEAKWLKTTPEQVQAGDIPIGEVNPDEFPEGSWEWDDPLIVLEEA
jgi:hypothetical protein